MLRGLTTVILLLGNLAISGTPVMVGGLAKLFVRGETKRRLILALARQAERWVEGNDWIFDRMLTIRWDIEGIEGLRPDGHYLVISNHISWVDILVLNRVFGGRAPFIRFFLKHELIWFPIAGLGCWALEFPFMKRHTAEYLEKHPEKRGEDLNTARRACRRYRRIPVTIANFIEGTRFTREKQSDQDSPYRHLLRPRVGGIAFVLASLGEQLDATFDVTLAYPGGDASFWGVACNRVPRIVVRVRRVEVPPELMSEAVTRPGPARDALKQWIDQLWRAKDAVLDEAVSAA